MKRFYIMVSTMLMLYLMPASTTAQYLWKMEQTDKFPLKASNGSVMLKHTSNWKDIEFARGIKGTAIRTDGYSTWLTASLPSGQKQPVTLSGWFALESFPTDTAAFFVLVDDKNGVALSACIDRFGSALIGIQQDGRWKYFATPQQLERFRWTHVALQLAAGKVQLLVNGTLKQSLNIANADSFRFNQLVIGKDIREKSIGMFPVTAINGNIDEVELSTRPLSVRNIRNVLALNPEPDLSIPTQRFANDFSRPKYHLLPAANWTNETHGLIYYKGRYHIFNQKNASNLFLGQINWGHFSSADLLSWIEHKPALSPEKGYDENGIWSGHVVLNEKGIPVIIYTAGGTPMGIGLAYPQDDELVHWKKYIHNPVIKGQPEGFTRTDLRDPYVFKEGGNWYMIVGFGITGEERGAVLLYKSTDLQKWTFLHTLFEGDPAKDNSGVFWEMPVFIKMNGKYILLVNKVPYKGVPAVALYWTGDFVNEKFVADSPIPQRLELVNRLLSPSVAVDRDGNVTAIAIIPDEIGSAAAYKNGWTHTYSIPRTWKFIDGSIHQSPHPAMRQLRGDKRSIAERPIVPGNNVTVSKGEQQLEIAATFTFSDAKNFGLIIGKDAAGSEQTKIYYDFVKQQFIVDQTRSSKRAHIPLDIRTGEYKLDRNGTLDLHVFIDGSVVEVFVNNKEAFTTRYFPQSPAADIVEVFSDGGEVKVKADVWILKPAANKAEF